ncbi:MAG: hypothetical protein ABIP41_10225 [Croceibacterium sp.]
MKILTIAVVAAAAALAVPALAQGGPPPDPYGDATATKADATKAAGERFAQLDANHDGSLTPEERRAGFPGGGGFGGGGGAGGPPPAQTKDEYVAAQLRRFDLQDADHDGNLTKAERDAFRAAMIARFQGGGQ